MKKIRYFCDVCGKEKPTQEYILPCTKYETVKSNQWTLMNYQYISSEKKDICDDCADNIITAIKIANAKSVRLVYTEETLAKLKKVFGDVTSQSISDSAMEEMKRMIMEDVQNGH